MGGLTTGSDPFIHYLQFRDKIANLLRSSYRSPNPNTINYYMFLAGIKTNHAEIVESIELIERPRELCAPTHNWHKAVYGRARYADTRYDGARNVLETVDDLTFMQWLLAMTYVQMGEQPKAGFPA